MVKTYPNSSLLLDVSNFLYWQECHPSRMWLAAFPFAAREGLAAESSLFSRKLFEGSLHIQAVAFLFACLPMQIGAVFQRALEPSVWCLYVVLLETFFSKFCKFPLESTLISMFSQGTNWSLPFQGPRTLWLECPWHLGCQTCLSFLLVRD